MSIGEAIVEGTINVASSNDSNLEVLADGSGLGENGTAVVTPKDGGGRTSTSKGQMGAPHGSDCRQDDRPDRGHASSA